MSVFFVTLRKRMLHSYVLERGRRAGGATFTPSSFPDAIKVQEKYSILPSRFLLR